MKQFQPTQYPAISILFAFFFSIFTFSVFPQDSTYFNQQKFPYLAKGTTYIFSGSFEGGFHISRLSNRGTED